MRKRSVNHLADTIFWYMIYFLPVLLYLITAINNSLPNFYTFMEDLGFGMASGNIIVSTLADLFLANGVLPLFSSLAPIYLLSWFVVMVILHLAVDFLLFIPRYAHKLMDKFCKGE